MSERDKVNNRVVGGAVLSAAVVLVAMVIGVYQLFQFSVREEIQRKVNAPPSGQLLQLRAADDARLQRYQWVDQKAGVVRVPVERAVELILSEGYRRPDPIPQVATGAGPGAAPDAGTSSHTNAGAAH